MNVIMITPYGILGIYEVFNSYYVITGMYLNEVTLTME